MEGIPGSQVERRFSICLDQCCLCFELQILLQYSCISRRWSSAFLQGFDSVRLSTGAVHGNAGAEAHQCPGHQRRKHIPGRSGFPGRSCGNCRAPRTGRRSESGQLVGRGLAGAARHEAALDGDVGISRDLRQGRVAAESKMLDRSPTRIIGPSPIFAGGRSALVSSEMTVTSSGISPEAASFIAPTKPTSSARVKRPRQAPSAADSSSSMNIATMTAQPMRSSHARAWMSPSRTLNSGRSHMRTGHSRAPTGFSGKPRGPRREIAWGVSSPGN